MKRNRVSGQWVLECRTLIEGDIVVPAAAFDSPGAAYAEVRRWREKAAA